VVTPCVHLLGISVSNRTADSSFSAKYFSLVVCWHVLQIKPRGYFSLVVCWHVLQIKPRGLAYSGFREKISFLCVCCSLVAAVAGGAARP
jgi:hypothetical protein